MKNETVPRLGDASGRPLRLRGVELIRARFGNSLSHFPLVFAGSLAVDVIIGRDHGYKLHESTRGLHRMPEPMRKTSPW